MRSYTQIRPVGSDSATDFVDRQQKRANNELEFFDSTTVKVERTTRGIRMHAKIPPSSPAGGAGLNNRGEYDPTATYVLNDLVVISMGINQGTFVCITQTVSGVPPYTGGGDWQQLPGGVLGQWQ